MLLLTESTLFFINMMRSSASDRPQKLLSNVNQWISRVGKEQETNSEPLPVSWTISTATEGPPSTIPSNATQTTGATSVQAGDEDCDVDMQEETTYYGDFGEDGDDMQEQEAVRLAGKDKVVSSVAMIMTFVTVSSLSFAGPHQVDSTSTSVEGKYDRFETQAWS